jgi:hypothetical protein
VHNLLSEEGWPFFEKEGINPYGIIEVQTSVTTITLLDSNSPCIEHSFHAGFRQPWLFAIAEFIGFQIPAEWLLSLA